MTDETTTDSPTEHQHAGWTPKRGYRILRFLTQTLAFLAIIVAPFLGGWQRLERNFLSAWYSRGWDLPPVLYDALPGGEAARKAYEVNEILGGGSAVDYVGVPVVDPVAGFVAMLHQGPVWHTAIAWGIPVLLALVFGRVFCGWFCPFGVLARAADRLVGLLPFEWRGFAVPQRRPIRWLILAGAALAGILGFEGLLYIFLPHVLVQQAGYSLWLLGGGGAVLGALLGLLAAGVVMGPTVYCATLCPTGAALSIFSRFRRVEIDISDQSACGACQLCNRACWLGLDPSDGNPGPDCDICTRCFSACPRSNMVLRVKTPSFLSFFSRKKVTAILAALFSAALVLGLPSDAGAKDPIHNKPELLLSGLHEDGDLTLAVSVVDLNDVAIVPDAPPQTGVELSAFMGRGTLGDPDDLGRLEGREVYKGPLTVEVHRADGSLVRSLEFAQPQSPRSTPNRTIYRKKIETTLEPGASITVLAVDGWLAADRTWEVPNTSPGDGIGRIGGFALSGFLVAFGLLSLAIAVGRRPNQAEATAHP